MFTVERESNGFLIRIGDGKRRGYKALTIANVNKALSHYWEMKHYSSLDPDCPLCEPA